MPSSEKKIHRERFYELIERLATKTGYRTLDSCTARGSWPDKGVYFFFEQGEKREDGKTPRVVRVGTHAIQAKSRTTLWKRLLQHKGTAGGENPGGGNHRGSVFRLHVGCALMARYKIECPTWLVEDVEPELRKGEYELERFVSREIRQMPFLWLHVPGESGRGCPRAFIEKNAIALLSCIEEAGSKEEQGNGWLGNFSPKEEIRKSRLWNVDHVKAVFEPGFMEVFEELVERMP